MKAFFSLALLATSSVFSQSLPVDLSFDQGSGFDSTSVISTLSQLQNGKIFIGGSFSSYNNSNVDNMVLLSEDGVIDANFICNDCINGNVTASVIQSDQIILGGTFTAFNGVERKYIARINDDGSLDESFNLTTSLPSDVASANITQLSVVNNKIYLSGAFYNSSFQAIFNPVIRLNLDGSIDESFQFDQSLDKRLVSAFSVQTDGSVVFVSKTSGVFKLNENGSIDDTFLFESLFLSTPSAICVLPDGKFLLGGRFVNEAQESFVLMRYNSNGSLDETFNAFEFNFLDTLDGVFSIEKFGSNYLATGRFTDYDGVDDFIGINADGVVNYEFIVGGLTSYPNVSDTAYGSKLLGLSSGKILLAGQFGKVNNTILRNLVCLDALGLGIAGFINDNHLSVYYDNNNCNFTSSSEIITTVEIFDLSGRLVASDNVNSYRYSYQLENNSILLYRLTMNDGKIYTGKMIN
ncbi:hypothetical protein [Flavobacterium alkalisoli]|uniref:hypothetical protein n=1 Tax=Flavobacterium alkalisoli TaxID=2602769 RepID=UPI003A92BA28